jgi:hypothetical protein
MSVRKVERKLYILRPTDKCEKTAIFRSTRRKYCGTSRSMMSLVFFAVAVPLLVFVMVCCLGLMGDRVGRRQFGIRDTFVLLTIVTVALGLFAAMFRNASY